MSKIDVMDLTFAYEGSYDNIFEHVSFQLDTDWKTGFTGRNGRGKTTFLRLLQGKYSYQGRISASVEFDYFPFPVDDPWELTQDVIESLDPDLPAWKVRKELTQLRLEKEVLYRPFGTLSQGEQTKVLLAVLFLRENHFLLIDEPTNHLDMQARQEVAGYLQKKKGFILVSHDRTFMDQCVDHMLALNRTDIQVQKGNFSSWYQNKQRQDEWEEAENERVKKEIRHLEEACRRTSGWSDQKEKEKSGAADRGYVGHRAAKMMKRSKSLERRQNEQMERRKSLLQNVETAEDLKIHGERYHSQKLVEGENLTICYDGREICKPLNFVVEQGEQTLLQGRNGCGKSSLIHLILGDPIEYKGILRVASGLRISYVSQDTSFLHGDLRELIRREELDESLMKAILRKLDFSRLQFEKPMESYSEGQKKKVLLARSLCQRAHLYIWDEPLNYIDVDSRIQLERLLTEYRPTMLLVEHDQAFAERVATREIRMMA